MNPTTINFRPVNPLYSRIDAIQAVREFTRDVLGIPLSPNESKDFVDNLIRTSELTRAKDTLRIALASARDAGLTTTEMREIIDRVI